MNTAKLFVQTLTEFFKRNPYGDLFAKRLEPFCANIGPDMAAEIAAGLCANAKSFPTLRVCQAALERAERRLAVPVSGEPKPWERQAANRDEWERRLAGIRLCRNPIGREADRDGWLPALIEFAAEHARLPDGREVERVKAVARRCEDGLAECRESPLYRNLVNLRRGMQERAHRDVFGLSPEPRMSEARQS